ncbi:MAG TPA: hypothetical protein VK658_29170 [Chryseolinea sp.]|nr:hypothetical protein [Chryseolinea sp.]
MKLTRLLLLLLPITLLAQPQPQPISVPVAAAQAIKKLYPEASELSWEKKKELYRAKFKTGKVDHKVWLQADGTVSRHEYEIKKDQLPKPVTDAIAKDFSAYTIGDCEQNDEKGATSYKVELKSPQGKKNVQFLSDGKVHSKKSDD